MQDIAHSLWHRAFPEDLCKPQPTTGSQLPTTSTRKRQITSSSDSPSAAALPILSENNLQSATVLCNAERTAHSVSDQEVITKLESFVYVGESGALRVTMPVVHACANNLEAQQEHAHIGKLLFLFPPSR